MTAVTGIDVSNNNGDVNWEAVARAGVDFAVCKVSEGDWMDPTFTPGRVRAIRAAGIIPGGYVFLRPRSGRSGADEAEMFYERGRECGLWTPDGQRVKDVRPVIDVEASSFDVDTWRGRRRTRLYVRSAARYLREQTGRVPIIYTGYFWRDDLNDPKNGHTPFLWYPEYGPNNGVTYRPPTKRLVPRPWRRKHGVAIHQWTDEGQCPGVRGRVDLNRYLDGDLRHFKAHMCI